MGGSGGARVDTGDNDNVGVGPGGAGSQNDGGKGNTGGATNTGSDGRRAKSSWIPTYDFYGCIP
jgi:hypothetical protein